MGAISFSKPAVAAAAEVLIAKHYVCTGSVADSCAAGRGVN